jgi:WD40 repeat protein
MARVVCQVAVDPKRITFRWSEADTSFEPCFLSPEQTAAFWQTVKKANAALPGLAQAQAENDADALRQHAVQLAAIGHQLHTFLFPDTDLGREIRQWLSKLYDSGNLVSLEIIGDTTNTVPWNVVYELPPDKTAFQSLEPYNEAWRNFWGIRFCLAQTPSYSLLRKVELLDHPGVLLVVDSTVRDKLSQEQQDKLDQLIDSQGWDVAGSVTDLELKIGDTVPDVLYLFCRVKGNALLIGGDEFPLDRFQNALRKSESPQSPWNNLLVFLNPALVTQEDWAAFQESFQPLPFAGVILPRVLLPLDQASDFALDFLEQFLAMSSPLGEIVQNLRSRHAPAGLVFATHAPPRLQVSWEAADEDDSKKNSREDEEAESIPLPSSPFRPFIPCDQEDRALFVGRENDVAAVAGLLASPHTRFLFLHGRAGIGKTSLLRAGLLPALVEDAAGYLALRDRSDAEDISSEADYPVLAVRGTNDLPYQLALAVCAFSAAPFRFSTPTGRQVIIELPELLRGQLQPPSTQIQEANTRVTAEPSQPGDLSPAEVRSAFLENTTLFAQLLRLWGERLPVELVILIERGEEIFTLSQTQEDLANRNTALAMLGQLANHAGTGKVIVSLRTEYLARWLARFRQTPAAARCWKEYLLPALDVSQLTDVLLQPTTVEAVPYSTDIPRQRYRFQFEDGLAESMAREALQLSNQGSEEALPLLQILGDRLYALVANRDNKTITTQDLTTIGGVAGGTARYAEQLLLGLFAAQNRPVQQLLLSLYARQPDGTLIRTARTSEELAAAWRGPVALNTILQSAANPEINLLEELVSCPGGQEQIQYSLGHDALVPVVAQWDREAGQKQFAQKRVADVLWILIPLAVLACTVTWFFTKMAATRSEGLLAQAYEQQMQKLVGEFRGFLGQEIEKTFLPLYVGQMHQAQQAIDASNVSHALELLRKQNPNLAAGERSVIDYRGFEWHYLWGRLHEQGHTLTGDGHPVLALSLSPSGDVLVSGNFEGKAHFWDTQKRQLTHSTDKRILQECRGVAVSPDGEHVALANADHFVYLAMLTKNKDTTDWTPLDGHTKPVNAVAFSPNGKILASAGDDHTILLWDVEKKKRQHTLKGHIAPVKAILFSPDGKSLVSGGDDHRLLLWDVADGMEQSILVGPEGTVHALALSPDGKTLVSAGLKRELDFSSGLVKFWSFPDGKPLEKDIAYSVPVLSATFTPDGATLVTGSQDGLINLWETASRKHLRKIFAHADAVNALAMTAGGKQFYSGSSDGFIKLWDVEQPPDVIQAHEGDALCLSVSPHDRWVATGGRDGKIKIWEIDTGKLVQEWNNAKGAVMSLDFSQKDDHLGLAAGTWDQDSGQVILFEAREPKKGESLQFEPIHTLTDHKAGVTCVAFSPDGKWLASGSMDKSVRIWDRETGKVKHTFLGRHKEPVYSLAFSPDGGQLASGGKDGVIYFWNLQLGTPFQIGGKSGSGETDEQGGLTGHNGPVRTLHYQSHDALFISAGDDGKIIFWDLQEGKSIPPHFQGGPVSSLAMTPDGKTLVAAGHDSALHFWDFDLIRQRFTLHTDMGAVHAVEFTGNGLTMIAAGQDGTLRFWRTKSH